MRLVHMFNLFKKKEQNNNSQGITLIALVITIIVMLILAAVTLAIALNGGLFGQAGEAAKSMDVATIKEQITDGLTGKIIERMRKDEIITVGDVTGILDQYVQAGYHIPSIENGKIIFDGIDFYTLTKGNWFQLEDMNIFGIASNEENTLGKLVANGTIKAGDYITYPGNGYTNWRVLYTEPTRIEVISNESVKVLELSGKAGYNNMLDILNGEAEEYVNSTYATRGRCVGSDPENPTVDTTRKAYEDYPELETNHSDLLADYSNYSADFTAMANATSQGDPLNFYWNPEEEFWICAREVSVAGAYFTFSACVSASWEPGCYTRWIYYENYGSGGPGTQWAGLRPVVQLRSNCIITGGTGTSSDPWTL